MKNKLIILSLLMCPSLLSLGACTSTPTTVLSDIGTNLGTLFVPKADLSITNLSSTDITKGVSIIQSFKTVPTGFISEYKFNDPLLTIVNRPGLPRVIFKQLIVQYALDSQQLPPKTIPITFTIPTGGQFSGTVPMLSGSQDLVNTIFPNGSVASTQTASAQATLLGVDDNNNLISLNFNTPVRFESDTSGLTPPSAAPSASPNP